MGSLPIAVTAKARAVVESLALRLAQDHGIGSMSPAVYDTAWVALITKENHGKPQWLFPECFQYIVRTQGSDGSWRGDDSNACEADTILNGLAATLALTRHARRPDIESSFLPLDIFLRIAKATQYLEDSLRKWDVESTVHVGFEILVPSLLRLLELEGFRFQFPGHTMLMALNEQKLAKIDPRSLYNHHQTTLVHSLEAFIGKIDFDQVSHHLQDGAMMASPASTAAYLMHCSSWNSTAEEYLRKVVAMGGGGKGGVPSAFPITIFEVTWVLSTLLASDFPPAVFKDGDLPKLANFLESQLQSNRGIVGFAPGLLPDADDTAKTILTLNLLQRPTKPDHMVAGFEALTHFQTYSGERNESFSANCNVLTALLYVEDLPPYFSAICKAVTFLCNAWCRAETKDKWNISKQYSMMFLAQTFVRLLHLWDNERLPDFDEVRDRIPIVLFQIMVRTMWAQSSDGSWGRDTPSPEISAYAVLTLKSVASLPWAKAVTSEVQRAIVQGMDFLIRCQGEWTRANSIWVEKVTYGSSVLSETYCLAALNASSGPSRPWGEKVQSLVSVPDTAVAKFTEFFSRLPLFSERPKRHIKAAVIEGYLFLPQLKRDRLKIFPRTDMAEDKYLEYIPFTWTGSNIDNALSNSILWDMMTISMLNYQADEFMEAVVGNLPIGDLPGVKAIIHRLCDHAVAKTAQSTTNGIPEINGHSKVQNGDEQANGVHAPRSIDQAGKEYSLHDGSLRDVEAVLSRFISHVLTHPKVLQAPASTYILLRKELSSFLLSHVTHCEDNLRFSQQQQQQQQLEVETKRTHPIPTFNTPQGTYFDWVRMTSADHTSCPYSFVFFSCLIAKNPPTINESSSIKRKGSQSHCFQGVRQHYLSQALCRHLASMCRQYNDYGSIRRDRAEGNLNSVNFPEFNEEIARWGGGVQRRRSDGRQFQSSLGQEEEDAIKADLFYLAEYERECLDAALARLETEMADDDPMLWKALKTFVRVTDLYGQIYVARDIASRMK